jgi:hypothetical protein
LLAAWWLFSVGLIVWIIMVAVTLNEPPRA